ncbi:MAG: type IX secretion system membrane protein PorP/SprF [Cytophagaceae bacterium]
MKKFLHFALLTLISALTTEISRGQDVQFSQYYASPVFLNPAFAATPNNTRLGLQYRDQWRAIGNNFRSGLFHGAHLFERANSGLGLIAHKSLEGSGRYSVTEFALVYAYRIKVGKKSFLIPAIQAGMSGRSIDFSNLDFPDQYTNNGMSQGTSENLSGGRKNFADFSAGILYYNKRVFAGFSSHHLSQPNQALISGNDPLPRKYSGHAGYKIFLSDPESDREQSFILTANYKFQGKADQLDAGAYFILNPITFGLWYRGLPMKTFAEFRNNESVVGMIGLHMKHLRIGYSYDYVISALRGYSGAVHEISLNLEFYIKKPKAKNLIEKYGLPIPMF